MIKDRIDGPTLQFGTPFGGLFSNAGSDPRDYCGPPIPKRVVSPAIAAPHSSASSTASMSAGRSRSRSPDGAASIRRGMRIPRELESPSVFQMIGNGGGQHQHTDSTQQPSSSPAAAGSRFVPTKTLENLDLEQHESLLSHQSTIFGGGLSTQPAVVLLDSPRSVEACLRLGLSPFDFFPPTYDALVRHMKDHGEDVSDERIVKLRFSYLVQRARQKHVAACQERVKIMCEHSIHADDSGDAGDHHSHSRGRSSSGAAGGERSSSGGTNHSNQGNSTRILEEEKRLKKIVENNKSRLRQQLLHAQLIEKQREREEQRMEAQKRQDDLERKRRAQEALERTKKEEEAHALRMEARELERQEQQRRVELKRALYDAKDRHVKDRIAKQRLEAEAENEAKRLLNLERQRQMKEQAEQVVAERKEELQRRNAAFEAAQMEFKRQQEIRREARAATAKRKAKKIHEAIVKSQEQQAAKIHRALKKEEMAETLRKEQARIAAEEHRQRQLELEEKEQERQAVIREAQLLQQQRVEKLQDKLEATEEHMEQLKAQREAEARVRAEIQRQKELDKSDAVQRSKHVEAFRITKLEQKNQEKIERVVELQRQQDLLKEKRKLHREEAERTRVVIQDVTPGPSDFVPLNGTIAAGDGPKWRLGLPASSEAMRVVMKHVPVEGYRSSPGPCIYRHETTWDARHRRAEAFSLSRHDRWKSLTEASITPGPADYFPEATAAPKSRPSSSAL